MIKSTIDGILVVWILLFWAYWFSPRRRTGKFLAINVMVILILGIVAAMTMLMMITTTHDFTPLDWVAAILTTISAAWLVVEINTMPRPPYPF